MVAGIRWSIRLADWAHHKTEALAVRLHGGVHPKHSLPNGTVHEWYLSRLSPNDMVADLGCGPGGHAIRAARRCRWVTAVDRDPRALALAQAVIDRAHLQNISLHEWDLAAGTLSLPSSRYDAVLCLDVIEHLEARQVVLTEIRRLLRPHGRLFVSAPNRDTAWRRRLRAAGLAGFYDPDHKIEYTASEFRAELRAAGFTVETMEPITLDTPLAGWIALLGAVTLSGYRWLTQWRQAAVRQRPGDTTGWRVVAVPKKSLDTR